MTSTSNLSDVVRHYQRSIERHGQDEKRLLHCISKLFNLPIKFEHLQETGIGKTVNNLRKINGEIGVAAKTLVTKWKAMVAAQEEPKEQSHQETPTPPDSDGHRRSSDEDQDQENKGSNSTSGEEVQQDHQLEHQSEHHRNHSHSKTKSKHDERSSKSKSEKSGHHNASSSHSRSQSKSKTDQEKKHKSSRHDKSKESHKSNKEHRHEDKTIGDSKNKDKEKTSLGNHKSSSSSSSSSKPSSRHEKAKDSQEQRVSKDKPEKHKSSSSSSTSATATATATKSSKRKRSPQRQEEDSPKRSKKKSMTEAVNQDDSPDGFDSSMGANFDDVLGMLNMPMSSAGSSKKSTSSSAKGKSSSKVTTTTTTATTSSTISKSPSPLAGSSSGRSANNRKLELLAPTAKLEPLDPSIALELPTISNNYKPMPLNQTVMDVVFNQGGGGGGLSTSSHKSKYFNESEALAQGISSKTMRTKIYSGVKTGQILQVPSLFDLCTRVLQRNIDALEYTGGVPFEVLRPVLERATPQQLLNFEDYNPYLMDDSEVLWQQHVQRHCRGQQREEMETCREMYLRCQEDKERKLSILSESIKASQKLSEAPVRKTQLAFVDSMVKPPRSVQRKQDQYGTRGKLIATPAARVAALSSVTPNAAKVGDARLRVLAATRDTAQVAAAPMRIKKAPLMAKTLQFMRGRHKR